MTATVEQVALSELRPHPRNPRNGDIDAIAESLRSNGQYMPLVIAKTGVVLVGNHRYAAMMELGWDTADVIRLPHHHDDEAAIKILLADNRTSDRARYDEGALLELLTEVDEAIGLYGTGYDSDDLARLVEAVSTPLDTADLLTPGDSKYVEQYGVIVICEDARAQEKVYGELRENGYQVRIVTT